MTSPNTKRTYTLKYANKLGKKFEEEQKKKYKTHTSSRERGFDFCPYCEEWYNLNDTYGCEHLKHNREKPPYDLYWALCGASTPCPWGWNFAGDDDNSIHNTKQKN